MNKKIDKTELRVSLGQDELTTALIELGKKYRLAPDGGQEQLVLEAQYKNMLWDNRKVITIALVRLRESGYIQGDYTRAALRNAELLEEKEMAKRDLREVKRDLRESKEKARKLKMKLLKAKLKNQS
jgi:hypothetical protein